MMKIRWPWVSKKKYQRICELLKKSDGQMDFQHGLSLEEQVKALTVENKTLVTQNAMLMNGPKNVQYEAYCEAEKIGRDAERLFENGPQPSQG